ncbi:hypothetical protein OXPF_37430 [Oxobacter pfennigii]|uniref:Uncharacterized protein n=1 Tax=Oxobacter pfennigii TaxID=36849 RepID=A0A0P8YSM2_9CLOT|nr:hypothetical protein [Oxobacter pfennigii]KPU42689.1 hypothetical protein OXPF_37430 [Oxobacter pfennigii]
MKEIGIAVITIVVTIVIVFNGINGNKILFINGPRSAVITLGAIGMLFCTISIGKFITAAPAHPLTILGYLVGTVALLVLLTQIFKWNLPFVHEPETALYVMAACIAIKTVIGRFSHFIR